MGLYQRKPETGTWYVRFQRDGKRIDASTGTKDRAQAEQIAGELLNQAEASRLAKLGLRWGAAKVCPHCGAPGTEHTS